MELGLIGTGLMGRPMGLRLLGAGHRLSVFNRTTARLEPLAAAGARVAARPAEVLAAAEGVVLMLGDFAAIRSTVLSEEARPRLAGRTILQMGTIAPGESLALAAAVASAGGSYLEAPVLGSVPQATDGTLIIMVGAEPELFSTWAGVLGDLGREPRLIGPVGSASALKLALNQLIASLAAAFSLSLAYVRSSNLPVDPFMEILRSSAFYAPTFDRKLPSLLAHEFSGVNFPARHLLKDVRLFLAEAKRHRLDAAPLAGVEQLLERTLELGHGDSDYSALALAVEHAAE